MAEQAKRAAGAAKVFSIAAVLTERRFEGSLETGGGTTPFVFAPLGVAVANGATIVMRGDATLGSATTSGVSATLMSTQGELGQPPQVRKELLAMTAQGPPTGTADVQEAGHTLPYTEKTGDEGFVGVMYLRLSPLAPVAGLDLGAVQLNARLMSTSDTERELQWLLSGLVRTVHGERSDRSLANAFVEAINSRLKA